MRRIFDSAFTDKRRSFKYFLISCILPIAISPLMPNVAMAQEEINNEYRVTFVPTYPVSKKIFLTTYLGYVNIPNLKQVNYYVGAPLLVTYRINPIVEVMAGAFLVVSRPKEGLDNTEVRPLAGVKVYLPNDYHLNIYNWTRYEYRSFHYADDESLDNVKNRLRNRIGIELPLSKNAWQPKTLYALTDFEFFYTFEKGYFDRFRERLGLGYIIDPHWRVELIYHIQMKRDSEDLNPVWTDNIWRLNIKWTIPHVKHGPISHPPDVED
ncbi:MAG TPA: DUF2490 domain-containing protein [Chryseolinea sp.]|nr:DUF2490 domain-containing protein [Chryseolinea sp.]